MAEKNHRGKKQPQLKVVDEDDSVLRLGGDTPDSSPAKKKAFLRRSNESNAIARDLVERETAQVPTSELPLKEEGEIAPSQPATPLRIPPAFFVLVAIAFLFLLGVGIFLALGGRHRESRNAIQERTRDNIQIGQQEKEKARDIVEALTTAIQNYTSARTIEEKLPYVRQPERVEPLIRDYYLKNPLVAQEGAKLISQYALPIESSSFVILTASFPNSPNRIFLAEADTELNITIDWESDVCYQPVDIVDYISEKPTDSVELRVFAKPDNFYVYEFSDSSKYQCLKLTFRDNDEFLFGYIEKNTPASKRLADHFQRAYQFDNKRAEPLLLKVRFPENSKGERGVLIEDFLAPRWANIEDSKIYE